MHNNVNGKPQPHTFNAPSIPEGTGTESSKLPSSTTATFERFLAVTDFLALLPGISEGAPAHKIVAQVLVQNQDTMSCLRAVT